MTVADEERPTTKVDYIYKRCYVNRQGNLVDPRTPWDILLKYHKHYQRVLVNFDGDYGKSVDHKARREIGAERAQQEKRSRSSRKESEDLKSMGNERRLDARRRMEQLTSKYI